MHRTTKEARMPGPLAGLRVADLTRVLAGPYCTMQLGDLGAEVIKIESPGGGDDTRAWGPPFINGESAYFLSINRNKRSVTLNLKADRGKEILWALLERCDVLVENFRPGALERLGFGYAAVHAALPSLIYCSISGFGHSGPQRDLPGYDVLIQGESGLMSLTGGPDTEPFKLGTSISDLTAGMSAVQGILAALLQRQRSGLGQHVDISMLDASVALLTYQAGIHFATGEVPRRRGNAHPSIVPYSTYPSQDGTLIVGVGNDALFVRFCKLIGRPELATDERFATAAARVEHREALDPLLCEVLTGRPRDEWIALLRQEGIPCGAVRDVAEVCASPQLAARDMLPELEHPRAGRIRQLGSPLALSETPSTLELPPPLLGQHTEEVLQQLLGLAAEEVARLRESGVV
jgi:crotonobetainyl-CoA:carnitine CoA-transferase CaiB-like acyl-CoA transferase